MKFLPFYISLYLTISVIPIIAGTNYSRKYQNTEYYLFYYMLIFLGFGLIFSLFVNLIIYKILMNKSYRKFFGLALLTNLMLISISVILIFCFKDPMKILIVLGIWFGVSLGSISNILVLVCLRNKVDHQSIEGEKPSSNDTEFKLVLLE